MVSVVLVGELHELSTLPHQCADDHCSRHRPSNEHNDITASLLSRAQRCGYKVLVVNVDTYIVGWRPTDMDEGKNEPSGKPI